MSPSSRSVGLLSIGFFAAVVGLVGCSSSTPNGEDGVSSADEALTMPPSLCGKAAIASIDDIPAYANDCGNVNVWSNDGRTTRTTAGSGSGWVQTEGGYGYQCTELASRYMHFRYGTATHWGIAEAKDMCATHPADVSKTTTPVEGDLMVFAAGKCVGAAGHVGVISSTSSTSIAVVQQNETASGKGTYARTCASCFLHAARNNPCGQVADGTYCGASKELGDGKKGTLYVCKGHAVASSKACADGCEGDSGKTDECVSADADEDAGLTSNDDAGEPTSIDEDASTDQPEGPIAAPGQTEDTGGSGCSASPARGASDPSGMLLVALGAITASVRRRLRSSKRRAS